MHVGFYWVIIELKWRSVQVYNMGNKLSKCKLILSYHLLVQKHSMETPCDIKYK